MTRELDAAVARAMGICPHMWEYYETETTYCAECGTQLTGPDPCDDYPAIRCRDCGKEVRGLAFHVDDQPHCKPYSTDIAAAYAMEDWIDHQGSIARTAYGNALIEVLGIVHYPDMWSEGGKVWEIACSTPEQRCRAFLKAMGEEASDDLE